MSAHDRVRVDVADARGLEALARYLMRSPLSLTRMRFALEQAEVIYTCRNGHDSAEGQGSERLDAMEFLARVLAQIPEPRRHSARYYGHYSCVSRCRRRKALLDTHPPAEHEAANASTEQPPPASAQIAARKRRWADLIRRIYEVDPLVCRCGGAMRIISFITEPPLVERILDHLQRVQACSRGSPPAPTPSPALP